MLRPISADTESVAYWRRLMNDPRIFVGFDGPDELRFGRRGLPSSRAFFAPAPEKNDRRLW